MVERHMVKKGVKIKKSNGQKTKGQKTKGQKGIKKGN